MHWAHEGGRWGGGGRGREGERREESGRTMCKEKRHGESVKKKRAALDSKDSWDSSDTEPEKLKKKTPRQQQLSMFFGAHEPSVPGKESTDAGAPSAEDRTTETAATVVTSDDDSDASNDFDFDLPQQASDGTQMAGKASEGKANVQSNVHSTESQLLPGWVSPADHRSHAPNSDTCNQMHNVCLALPP